MHSKLIFFLFIYLCDEKQVQSYESAYVWLMKITLFVTWSMNVNICIVAQIWLILHLSSPSQMHHISTGPVKRFISLAYICLTMPIFFA